MRFGGQKWKKSKIKIWNLEEKEKFLLWKYAYFSRNMKGKVIYKPFFIFFVYPLRGPSPVGKLTLKNLKTHFSFYLYIYTPKLGVAIILKGFFVFMTHPIVHLYTTFWRILRGYQHNEGKIVDFNLSVSLLTW